MLGPEKKAGTPIDAIESTHKALVSQLRLHATGDNGISELADEIEVKGPQPMISIGSVGDTTPLSECLGFKFGEERAEAVIGALAIKDEEKLVPGGGLREARKTIYPTKYRGIFVIHRTYAHQSIEPSVEIVTETLAANLQRRRIAKPETQVFR